MPLNQISGSSVCIGVRSKHTFPVVSRARGLTLGVPAGKLTLLKWVSPIIPIG